jgi:hypothetical protein
MFIQLNWLALKLIKTIYNQNREVFTEFDIGNFSKMGDKIKNVNCLG